MAKKKKQKKAGLAKRRINKQQKRVATKRKIQAKQPVQKKISPAKLKQNLKNIPSLIFEPELQEIAFTPEQIKEVQAEHESVPDQIEALATEEFLAELKNRHETMKSRFEQEGDTNKTMMAHAIIYFMEQENAPSFLNQIIVAMYYNALHQLDNPEPLTIKQLNPILKEYEREWAEVLEEKAASMMTPEQDGDGELDEDELDSFEESGLFDEIIEEFVAYLESELSMDEEQVERTQEDVEVLINDYFEEKGVTDLESVRTRRIKTFLDSWFINTMHPTKEDMETMIDSLEAFFKFATAKEKISAEKGNEILSLLVDKESFLSNLDI